MPALWHCELVRTITFNFIHLISQRMDLTDFDDPLTFHVTLSSHYRIVALASYSSAFFFITQPKAQSQRQICESVWTVQHNLRAYRCLIDAWRISSRQSNSSAVAFWTQSLSEYIGIHTSFSVFVTLSCFLNHGTIWAGSYTFSLQKHNFISLILFSLSSNELKNNLNNMNNLFLVTSRMCFCDKMRLGDQTDSSRVSRDAHPPTLIRHVVCKPQWLQDFQLQDRKLCCVKLHQSGDFSVM